MRVKRKRWAVIDVREPTTTGARPSLWDRYFGVFACGIILISIFARTFDCSLMPLSCKDVFITRSYSGLHSDAQGSRAWAARSHAKYGLGYTKGYRTLALGDPPPVQAQRDVSHLPAETWIAALGMKLFAPHDWSVSLVDMILSVPAAKAVRKRLCAAGRPAAGAVFALGLFGPGGSHPFPASLGLESPSNPRVVS